MPNHQSVTDNQNLTISASNIDNGFSFIISDNAPAENVLEEGCNLVQQRNVEDIASEILSHKNSIQNSYLQVGWLLLEAKDKLRHGEWLRWLRNNVEIKDSTAQRLMRLSKEFSNTPAITDLGYTKASILIRLPENELSGFISDSHDVNGEQKKISDMSTRELEKSVHAYKKKSKRPV